MKNVFLVLTVLVAVVTRAATPTVRVTICRMDGRRQVRDVPLEVENGRGVLRVPAAEIGSAAETVEIEPLFATAKVGEPGYYVTPEGLYGRFHEKNGSLTIGAERNYMPMYGIRRVAFEIHEHSGYPH